MAPQRDSKDRNVVFFASGNISMDIFLPKTGYQQGEGLVVNGEIVNSSTRKIVPKYIIYQKQSFFAGKRAVHTKDILKEKDAPLTSSTRQNLSKLLQIPLEITPTIQNCRIIKVEYRLKVILDVSFTKNPVIKLPLVILPFNDDPSVKALEAGLYPDLAKLNL